MAETHKNQKRTRSGGTAHSRKRSTYRSDRSSRAGGRREEQEVPQRGKISLWRLTVSAVILVAAIAWNLLAPDALGQVRSRLLELMGAEGDFTAAFSAVGRVLDGQSSVRDGLSDACVAVFGTAEMPQDDGTASDGLSLYTQANLPADTVMEQRILGFVHQSPVAGGISDKFGLRTHPISGTQEFHYGLDLEADEGAVITAFADGTVTAVGESSLLGKYVTLQHDNGCQTIYAHCRCVTASSGQQVRMGDPIAEVGQTGQATGPHLHFELLQDGIYLNPVYYVGQ